LYALILAFFSSAFALVPPQAFARQKAFVIDGTSRRVGNDWVVSFRVEGGFNEQIENAILSGIPTSFTFHFSLYREVKGWVDDQLFSWKVVRTIHFDNLKRQFSVVMDNEGTRKTFTDFTKAKEAMVTFRDLPVVVAGSLTTQHPYYVKVKAEMIPINMPVVLNEIFFFVSFWEFKTQWHRIDLTNALNSEQ
jgi:hypothetical protein